MDTAILRRSYIIHHLDKGYIPEVDGVWHWYYISDDSGSVGSVRFELTEHIMLIHVAASNPTKDKLLSLRTAAHEINDELCDDFGYSVTHIASNKEKFVKYLTEDNYKLVKEDFSHGLNLYTYNRSA